jgi:hypothetical protein
MPKPYILSSIGKKTQSQDTPSYPTHWKMVESCIKICGSIGTWPHPSRPVKNNRYCAEQAVTDGLDFIWVDTCRIDKISCVKPFQAISSVFRRHRSAGVCYNFFPDLWPQQPLNSCRLIYLRLDVTRTYCPAKCGLFPSESNRIGQKEAWLMS